jgi:hypothetical protein
MVEGEQWVEIRRLHPIEKMTIKAIARRIGLQRNKVRSALLLLRTAPAALPGKVSQAGSVQGPGQGAAG